MLINKECLNDAKKTSLTEGVTKLYYTLICHIAKILYDLLNLIAFRCSHV